MNSSSRYFPHAAAGFRSNPFRALTDTEWADRAVIRGEIEAAYRRSESHIQLLGGMGAGKTTTLLGLQRLAADDGIRTAYEYLAEGKSRFSADLRSCDLLLLDEAQRLSKSELERLLDQCSLSVKQAAAGTGKPRALRLVFCSHQDLMAHFDQRGLPLTSFSVDQLPPAAWRVILDARLEAVAIPGRRHATLADDGLVFLAHRFGANRRASFAFLYEVFQQLREPVIVDAARLRIALAAIPNAQRATGSDAPASGTE